MMNTENVDKKELEKFANLAHHWWDPNGELKTLHEINPLRLRYIMQKTPLAGLHVLDVGCGGGILSESMAKEGAKVTGIDLNPKLIEIAKLHQLETGSQVEYLTIDTQTLALKAPHAYDVVTCLEVLEHVPDPKTLVKHCAQLVKPGGKVFFSTINRNIKAYLLSIIGAEYILRLLPKNTHDYAQFIRPSELSNWARAANLIPEESIGIKYNPFNKKFSLSPDISVNYILMTKNPP